MLLFRYLRLWYCLCIRTSNTEPTPYVHIHEERVLKYTLGRLVSQCFGCFEFTRFQIAKTKRVRRFLSICPSV